MAVKARILVADDDPGLVYLLKMQLQSAGYEVLAALSGQECIDLSLDHQPDMIVLDVMMPGMDGFQTCERLRAITDAPILFLTARAGETDIVRGFASGADDYLRKPFNNSELEARIAAILRRSQGQRLKKAGYTDGYLRIDLGNQMVYRQGKLVHLSPTEYNLLSCLVRNRGKVVTHEDLLKLVWGTAYKSATVLLSVYISYLREKLEENPGSPKYIRNKWGVGYWFAPQDETAGDSGA